MISLRTADDYRFVYLLKENKKELYDLSVTPVETPRSDLYLTEPEKAKELEDRLMEQYQEQYHFFYQNYGSTQKRELTERERAALKELGYIKD